MIRNLGIFFAVSVFGVIAMAQAKPDQQPSTANGSAQNWIAVSNSYARLLTDVSFQYHPEAGSQQGLSQYDNKVAQPTLADEDQERAATEAVLAKLKAAAAEKQQNEVAEDLQIMISRVQLNFKMQDYQRAHEVPFMQCQRTACLADCTSCWMSRRRASAGPRRWCAFASMPDWSPATRPHRNPEAACQGADGQAGRDLSRAGRDRNRDGRATPTISTALPR